MESGPVEALPLVGCGPLQPPEPVQEVALLLLQVKVAEPPAMMVCDAGVRLTVGAGGVTVTVAVAGVLPPAPVQVSV